MGTVLKPVGDDRLSRSKEGAKTSISTGWKLKDALKVFSNRTQVALCDCTTWELRAHLEDIEWTESDLPSKGAPPPSEAG